MLRVSSVNVGLCIYNCISELVSANCMTGLVKGVSAVDIVWGVVVRIIVGSDMNLYRPHHQLKRLYVDWNGFCMFEYVRSGTSSLVSCSISKSLLECVGCSVSLVVMQNSCMYDAIDIF